MLREHDKDKFIANTRATVIAANMAAHKDDPRLGACLGRINSAAAIDANNPRIIHANGHVDTFGDNKMALEFYYSLPKGCRAAFRGIGDFTPVYPHDCVDK